MVSLNNNTFKACASIFSAFFLACFLVYQFNFIGSVYTFIYIMLATLCVYLPFKDASFELKEQNRDFSFLRILLVYKELSFYIKLLRYCFFTFTFIAIVDYIGVASVLFLLFSLSLLSLYQKS